MEIHTPAIIFPAISLLMLAYTNRFMVISQRIRSLHERYTKESNESVLKQIANLRTRFTLIRWMQAMGVMAFICCSTSMLMIHLEFAHGVGEMFGLSIALLIGSLCIALYEIMISTKAIEIELQTIEDHLE